MKHFAFIAFGALLFAVIQTSAQAQTPAQIFVARATVNSETRYPGESAAHAFQRYRARLHSLHIYTLDGDSNGSAVQSAKPIAQLEFSNVPQWKNGEETFKAFAAIRDMRFLKDPEHDGFIRRSSWLYPDDGCFARAALMGQNLEKMHIVRPAKAFIFGNLTVKTVNNPNGAVRWWYHVVPIVMIDSIPVVLDPAINPMKPLYLKDWVLTMTNDPKSVTMSLCDPTTYAPSNPCYEKSDVDMRATEDQMYYLSLEWSRVVELHRNPLQDLGESPPWLNP